MFVASGRWRYALVAAVAWVALAALMPARAAADRGFALRYDGTDHGQITMAANTLMTCPPSGRICGYVKAGYPFDNDVARVDTTDVDSDPSTFDSSRAALSLPAGATVLFAGLYWSADTSAGRWGRSAPDATSRASVRFAPPGGAYRTVTAGSLDTDGAARARYQGFADVTDQVAAAGSGTYTVGDVQTGTGLNRYAGWSLVVAYRSLAEPARHLAVYDGMTALGSPNARLDVPISGFLTPSSGTVGGRVALLAWNGHRRVPGDAATLETKPLGDASNPPANIFNATIARAGSAVMTREPADPNTLGTDADELAVDGLVPNDATTTTLRVESPRDPVSPAAVAVSLDEGAPRNSARPSVPGEPRDGRTLRAEPGEWAGSAQLRHAYQWQRCDADGTGCADVPGATTPTYTPGPGDVGAAMRVVVTATDAGGSASAASAPTGTVAPAPPANTSPPSVEGTPRDGATLRAQPGSWSGTGPFSFVYRWQRCDAGGACSDISGATAQTYTVGASDVGARLRAVVTATNDDGSVTANSTATAPVDSPTSEGGDPVPPAPGGSGSTPPVDGSGTGSPPAPGGSSGSSAPPGATGSTRSTSPGAQPGQGAPGGTGAGPGGAPAPASPPPATGAAPEQGVLPQEPVSSDLSALPGSLLSEKTCETLAGPGAPRRVNLGAGGPVRIRVRADATVMPEDPATVTVTTARRGARARVSYRLDGRVVRGGAGPGNALILRPADLPPGAHTLVVALRAGRRGTRSVRIPLRTTPCAAGLTMVDARTRSGTAVRMRVDSRTPLAGVTFTVPALLGRGLAQGRPAGRLWIVTPTGRRQFVLTAAHGRTLLAQGAGRPGVRRNGRTIMVTGLPPSTGIVELTLDAPPPRRGGRLFPPGRPARGAAIVWSTRVLHLAARVAVQR